MIQQNIMNWWLARILKPPAFFFGGGIGKLVMGKVLNFRGVIGGCVDHICCKASTRSSSPHHRQNYHCHLDHYSMMTISHSPHPPSSLPAHHPPHHPQSSSFVPSSIIFRRYPSLPQSWILKAFESPKPLRPSYHLIQPSLGWQRCS